MCACWVPRKQREKERQRGPKHKEAWKRTSDRGPLVRETGMRERERDMNGSPLWPHTSCDVSAKVYKSSLTNRTYSKAYRAMESKLRRRKMSKNAKKVNHLAMIQSCAHHLATIQLCALTSYTFWSSWGLNSCWVGGIVLVDDTEHRHWCKKTTHVKLRSSVN